MRYAADNVGIALADETGDSFGLMFDGWTNNSIYMFGIFAGFEKTATCASVFLLCPPWTTASQLMLISSTSEAY
jgi:hypothetical protein